MSEFFGRLDYGSVPSWLALGTLILAAATFAIAQRDRILKAARSVMVEGHWNRDLESFEIDVHNDSDTQLHQVEVQLWAVDGTNRKIQEAGQRCAAIRIGPKETKRACVIRDDLDAIHLINSGDNSDTSALIEVSFRDSNRRYWMLTGAGKPRRLWNERQRQKLASRIPGQRMTVMNSVVEDDGEH